MKKNGYEQNTIIYYICYRSELYVGRVESFQMNTQEWEPHIFNGS